MATTKQDRWYHLPKPGVATTMPYSSTQLGTGHTSGTGRDNPLRVAVTGASGLIGSALCRRLEQAGHSVIRLVRHVPHTAGEVRWDPQQGKVDLPGLAGVNAVVHLAAASIAGVWTPARRRAIRDSRIAGTTALARALARMKHPPQTLVCASATGYYGDRGDEVLTEVDDPGSGFLAGVCRDWEAAAHPAADAGIRTVHARLGIVLSADGGALAAMLPAARSGILAVLGSGEQYMSWITLADAAAALEYMLGREEISGPVNLTAPHPATNAQFNAALLARFSRRRAMRIPAGLMRLAPGGMGAEMLLAGQRALPVMLLDHGFQFAHVTLDAALDALLGKTG